MNTQRKAFRGCLAVGSAAVASSMVLAFFNPHPQDVGRQHIDQYVTSVEQNDAVAACEHARRAASQYRASGNAVVGEGWRVIADSVCDLQDARSYARLDGLQRPQ